jgi:hypothetical protein
MVANSAQSFKLLLFWTNIMDNRLFLMVCMAVGYISDGLTGMAWGFLVGLVLIAFSEG